MTAAQNNTVIAEQLVQIAAKEVRYFERTVSLGHVKHNVN